ncbi:MAG: hypothetical protein HYY57_01475 [Candidatus Omnitrophica bacterium]|nr:hypothetical protein [Candidatus Omnitrophota bacterium]
MSTDAFTRKQNLEQEIRNKITLPLTVLAHLRDGKDVPNEKIVLAIKSLREILAMLEKTG